MKSNQTLHITIKQPPNPNPVRSLGVFDDLDNPNISQMIQYILDGLDFKQKDTELTENIKDVVLQLITTQKVVAVQTDNKITCVYFQK